MVTEGYKRKLSAILSADVKGYSRLIGQDEVATVKTLKEYRELISILVREHHGRVVDSPGDNVLSEFGSVVDAVESAVRIQKELNVKNAGLPADRRMDFRIGINLGDIIEEHERIYGDGVNIAARIEALADPGGICISGTVYDQVENKLSLAYDYLGEHALKNIKKPLRVYRIQMKADAAAPDRGGELKLPNKPSIAVLPFVNMSGEPGQDYFSDGLTEEIITALSKISEMFVIARNSSFAYKGKPVQVQQVSRELGVQYVLEGSVRKAGSRLRITAQLIDATTGNHLWAERYDRHLEDVFDLQDEITRNIVVFLQVELTRGEQARVWHKSSRNLEALGHASKALDLFERFTKEDNARSRELFEQATQLDPTYAFAWTYLAWTYWIDASYGFSSSPSESGEKALELAKKSMAMDETQPDVHALWSTIFLCQGQHEKAIEAGKKALELGPNNACNTAILAQIMHCSGRGKETIELMNRAMRLSPYHPHWYLGTLALAYVMLGDYGTALEIARQQLDVVEKRKLFGTGLIMSHLILAEVYIRLDRQNDAKKHAGEILRIAPGFSLGEFSKSTFYKDPAQLKNRLEVLRKAGLPD
jgi:adenylate cyclase